MKTIKKEHYILTYLQKGDTTKTPIMVLGSAIYYPKLFQNPIFESFHLIFATHIGFSKVDPEKSPHTLANVVEDIELIRKELNIDSMYLLGHS